MYSVGHRGVSDDIETELMDIERRNCKIYLTSTNKIGSENVDECQLKMYSRAFVKFVTM